MSQAKHTPGPWTVPHLARPDVKCDCGYVLVEHLMGAVATVHSGDRENDEYADEYPPRAEAEANAHLIAAAPDLLAALEVLYGDVIPHAAPLSAIDDSLAAAEDAIARARGES